MENLHRRINKEMRRTSTSHSKGSALNKQQQLQKEQLISDLNLWIGNLKNSMHLCKYRQVIGEIESKKKNFKTIPEYHWKFQYIEIDAIFKILKKKFIKHKKEISKENSYQYRSCLFWFNQIFLLLEKLVLELRPDLNPVLDYKNRKILKPIQSLIDSFIKFIYLLLLFGQYNQQLPEILTYISFIDSIVPYMKYTSKSSSYLYLQKIQLFKVKILTENCEYMTAVEVLEENIDYCLECIRFLSDEDFNAYVFDFQDEKSRKYIEYLNKRRLFKSLEYKGSKKPDNNKNNILKSAMKFRNKKYTLSVNYSQKSKNEDNLSSSSKNKNSKKNNKINIINKSKILLQKEENKLNSSMSNNDTTSNNNNMKKKTVQIKSSMSQQNLKFKKVKPNLNSSIKHIENESNKNKKVLFITQVNPPKKMDKDKQKIIEEILSNIALNFYLRGAIFEHVGNIDSALDSYKEVEWFSLKFLTKRFPYFVKYMLSLLNCAWNNYNLIAKLRREKEKIRQKNLLIKNIELEKKRKKKEAEERHNEALMAFRSHRMKLNNKRLNQFLDDLGNKIYKEEEQRNFNIYNKFTKTGYILSTYKIIGDLLSDDFRKILNNMKKVEITKPDVEIQDLIDKALIKKQQNISACKENSNEYDNNINNNNNNNTRGSSRMNKESNNNSKNVIIYPFKKIKITNVKKTRKSSEERNNSPIDNSNQKHSSSCVMPIKNIKIINSLISSNEIDKRQNKKFTNKTKIYNYNHNYEYFNLKQNYSAIPKIKMHSRISSLHSSRTLEKVVKYDIDKDNFNKAVIKKKVFLDRYSNKEFIFLKNLLKTKTIFPDVRKPPDEFDPKKVKHEAYIDFMTKLEIAKSVRGKKNFNNLLKQSLNADNKKFNSNRSDTPTEQSENNFIDNKEKLRQLENECVNITTKREQLIKKKKLIIKKI